MQHRKYIPLVCLLLAFIVSSCGSNTDTARIPDARTEKMAGIFVDIVDTGSYYCDPEVKGDQPVLSVGTRAVKINGQPIYTQSDEKVKPKLTADGQAIVSNIRSFFNSRINLPSEKGEIMLTQVVIDEKGKVVFYNTVASGRPGNGATIDDLKALHKKAQPLLDSLQPQLLSITFEPVKVNGKPAAYYVSNIPGLN